MKVLMVSSWNHTGIDELRKEVVKVFLAGKKKSDNSKEKQNEDEIEDDNDEDEDDDNDNDNNNDNNKKQNNNTSIYGIEREEIAREENPKRTRNSKGKPKDINSKIKDSDTKKNNNRTKLTSKNYKRS